LLNPTLRVHLAATLAMTGTTILTYSASLENPAKKNISNLQIAPTLNIMLPEHWFERRYRGRERRRLKRN
jgi:hypothetical protein